MHAATLRQYEMNDVCVRTCGAPQCWPCSPACVGPCVGRLCPLSAWQSLHLLPPRVNCCSGTPTCPYPSPLPPPTHMEIDPHPRLNGVPLLPPSGVVAAPASGARGSISSLAAAFMEGLQVCAGRPPGEQLCG